MKHMPATYHRESPWRNHTTPPKSARLSAAAQAMIEQGRASDLVACLPEESAQERQYDENTHPQCVADEPERAQVGRQRRGRLPAQPPGHEAEEQCATEDGQSDDMERPQRSGRAVGEGHGAPAPARVVGGGADRSYTGRPARYVAMTRVARIRSGATLMMS